MKKMVSLLTILYLSMFILSCSTTATIATEQSQEPKEVTNQHNLSMIRLAIDSTYVAELEALGLTVDNKFIESPNFLSLSQAIEYTLDAVDMLELAWTMPFDKSTHIIQSYGVTPQEQAKENQLVATALSIGLFTPEWYKEQLTRETLSYTGSKELQYAAVEFLGIPLGYVGLISDNQIYKNLLASWSHYSIVENNELVTIVDEGVIQGVTTGYNVVSSSTNPDVNPHLSITYGHNDIKHAMQLIGLLRSEEIDGKVYFQGKTSAFLYLEAWGTPYETEGFKVKQIPSGDYVAYAKEYNITFEFASAEEKEMFNTIILQYAKKDTPDEEGLIYASWWQPLYSSTTPMGDGYQTITDNVITYGEYEAHPFSLNEAAEQAVDGFLSIDDTLQIESTQFWVNQAFFNYLMGESQ